jgi:hypothetical protein
VSKWARSPNFSESLLCANNICIIHITYNNIYVTEWLKKGLKGCRVQRVILEAQAESRQGRKE